jgi:hemerythrin-like domain-containing protein
MERRPTEMLEEEHHFIQKVVGAMAAVSERLEVGQEVDAETLQNIVEFMRTFADKCHHGKEETHLFPLLESRGVPVRGCPLAVLIQEEHEELHEELRKVTKIRGRVGEAAIRVAQVLHPHFERENELALSVIGLARELVEGKTSADFAKALELADKF